MYDQLKEELPHILALVDQVPAPFKDRCFELLLTHFLNSIQTSSGRADTIADSVSPSTVPSSVRTAPKDLVPPAKVRAFLSRHGLSPDVIERVVIIEGDEVHFIREPSIANNSQGQISWALLLALRNALMGNDFLVDPETVRSMCIDKGCYDKGNFAAYFKRKASLFRGPMNLQGDPQRLSPDGERELADVIRALAA